MIYSYYTGILTAQERGWVFARKIFVPCVMSWSFEEDCTVEAKMDFCGDDAILNKMAQQVSMKLMKMVQPILDEEEGN